MDKTIRAVIADNDSARACALAEQIEGAGDARVGFETACISSLADLVDHLAKNPSDVVLAHVSLDAGDKESTEAVSRVNHQYPDLPQVLLVAPGTALEQQVEWVHRGAQDVIEDTADGAALARSIRLSVERKHLVNDVQQALRLEQETVVKMQGFIDELVGYATRSSMGER